MDFIKIILADDHNLVRDGIKALLKDESDFVVIDEAANGFEVLEILKYKQPDLIIVDLRMPKLNGIELVQTVQKSYPTIKTLVLSMHDSEEYVIDAIESGADGYLLKGSSKEEFLKAVHTVACGGKYFTGDISAILINSLTKKRTSNLAQKPLDESNTPSLTKRELQILKLILKGNSNKAIALELKVSVRTTEVHRFNLMKKLKVNNLMELANKGAELDLS